jgi:endonuclease III
MDRKALSRALIEDQGRLWSEEIGARIDADTPDEWFHWLIAALLMSARISATQAAQAAGALKVEDLNTVQGVLESDREQRIRVLNENGYARFDNVGADQIFEAAQLVQEEYGGDLRHLRAQGGDANAIRARLKQVKGIGEVGADIFCREAQLVWDELFPMADGHAIEQARAFGLPDRPEELAQIAGGRERYVRLVTALARAWLDGPSEKVKEAAA